jgi:hypothetical protein
MVKTNVLKRIQRALDIPMYSYAKTVPKYQPRNPTDKHTPMQQERSVSSSNIRGCWIPTHKHLVQALTDSRAQSGFGQGAILIGTFLKPHTLEPEEE